MDRPGRGGGASPCRAGLRRGLRRSRRRDGCRRPGRQGGGGTTVGILPGESPHDANEWIDYAVATGTGHARNLAVVASCDASIVVGGRWGTLAEVAYARLLGRPVVVLEPGREIESEGVERAASPAEAVELALRLAGAQVPGFSGSPPAGAPGRSAPPGSS